MESIVTWHEVSNPPKSNEPDNLFEQIDVLLCASNYTNMLVGYYFPHVKTFKVYNLMMPANYTHWAYPPELPNQ